MYGRSADHGQLAAANHSSSDDAPEPLLWDMLAGRTHCYVAGVVMWRLGLAVAATLSVVGCSSPSISVNSNRSPDSTRTTAGGAAEASTTPTSHDCTSGTINVKWQPSEGETPVCVRVGSIVVLTGGDVMSGGTWPGPPTISNGRVLALRSSSASGTNFTANLKAIGTGSATVEVPFVAGPDVCNPTPCTPVPGRPLDWQVTVVA